MVGVDVPAQRYTTADIAASERFAYWREAICAVYVKLDAQPMGAGGFHGEVDVQDWGGLRLSKVSAGGQLVRRRRGEQGGDCLLSLQVRGSGTVSQAGHSAVLGPGDMALYEAARPYELRFPARFQQIVVQFPREELLDRGVDIEGRVAHRGEAGAAMTAITAGLLQSMRTHAGGLGTSERERLSVQALDCIAAALAPRAQPADGARRAAVLAHIARMIASPDLSVAQLAIEFGMSVRSLQRLFADGDAPLNERIRRMRLRQATSRLLADRDVSIARIAADSGFSDAAHFARTFRAKHGCSPTEHRLATERP